MSAANDILTRIANIQITVGVPGLGIPVVLQAEPYQPSDMNSVSCPFFVNEIAIGAGNGSDLPIANGQQFITTTIAMMLAVARKEANIDLKYGVENTLKWRDAVYAKFAQHVRLSAPTVLIKSTSNTNPITVVTGTPHCLNTAGDQVTISGHLLNTPANGVWNATIIDPVTFTIPVAGIAAGGATGQAVMTQNADFTGIIDAVIKSWALVPYEYGSTEFLALMFNLVVREMYTQTALP